MKKIFICIIKFFIANTTFAANSLLFIETQGVIGYSSEEDEIVYHSAHKYDAMQKNSLGFDYIKKISGNNGDFGVGALQMRLTYDDYKKKSEIQIYNAYLKSKSSFGDIWAGHNRTAFGLSSYWDTHGDLLQPLSMFGFGFDRDWGVGLKKDNSNSDFQFAITNGSGMEIKNKGNFLFTTRFSQGVLNYDNYNIGFSLLNGKVLDTMGYKVLDDEEKKILMFGFDFAFNQNNIEHKLEFDVGEKDKNSIMAGFYRISFNFLDENRLKIENQYIWTKQKNMMNMLINDYIIAFGGSYKINGDLTTRLMYQWQKNADNHSIIAQVYYYFLI